MLHRERIDHLLIYSERHLCSVLAEYECHLNDHRPHQGRSLRPPLHNPGKVSDATSRIRRRNTVTGLIDEYRRVVLIATNAQLSTDVHRFGAAQVPGIHRLDRVDGADDPADLGVELSAALCDTSLAPVPQA